MRREKTMTLLQRTYMTAERAVDFNLIMAFSESTSIDPCYFAMIDAPIIDDNSENDDDVITRRLETALETAQTKGYGPICLK